MTTGDDRDMTAGFYNFDHVVTGVMGLPPPRRPEFEAPTLTPAKGELSSMTVGMLLTSGAYYPDQPRMREVNDLSYRLLPRERDLGEVLFAHMTPIRAFALADPNVAYPRDRMLEFERDGVIGRLADNAVSMVGSITQFERLATETASEVVREFERMGVDLLLVLPFCPQCHQAAGVLARAIEKRGLPTTSITTLRSAALGLKPPRATFLNFPLGCPAGRPGRPEQQQEILKAALSSAMDRSGEWLLPLLPFRWDDGPDSDWHRLVDSLYRNDHVIRGTVRSHSNGHRSAPSLVGQEREFAIRCAC